MVVDEAALVERERELEVLGRLLAGAREGAGGVVVVEGPPGIGKSSLLAAARAAAGDLRVVSARGGELERELPFGVVRQLLEPVLVRADEGEREALLAGAAALAEPVLSVPGPEAGGEPAFSALHGLYWLAANLAAARPLLVVVDDVQWSDLASLRWLAYLSRRLDGVALALLLASRPGEGGAGQALLDELLAVPGIGVLAPSGLSEQAVGGLAAQALSGEVDAAFAVACHSATGGNPFLLRELFGELARRGIVPSAENAAVAGQLSSRGVGRAVRARLRRLAPQCTALARAVAVLGDPAEPGLAGRLAGLDEPAALRAADGLAGAVVLQPGLPLAFVHPLVRSTVYASLSSSERAAHHERAAHLLSQAAAPADRIAVHLLSAPRQGDAETVGTLRSAARSAGGRGAAEVAVSYLRRALEEPPSPQLGPVLAGELGEASLRAGDLGSAIEQLRTAARGLGDERARARAANALGAVLYLAQRPDEAVAALGAVIEALPEGERELGLRLQATRAIAATVSAGVWRELRDAGERFVLAGATPATTGERLALAVAGYEATGAGTAAQARELALRALAGGGLLADPGPESTAFWFAPLVLLRADGLQDAVRVCDDAFEWAQRHGSLLAFSIAAQLRAYALWRSGALADAEADAASALEHALLPQLASYAYATLINVLLARGRVQEAEDALRRASLELDGSRGALYFLQARARLRAASGRPDDALADLFACERLEREWDIQTPAYCTWRVDAAALLAALGRPEQAHRLAREELERCRAYGAAGPLGAALRTLASLEPEPAAIALHQEAVGVLEGSGARLEHALALLALGAAVHRAGRRADARTPLREALELARACAADAVAARAHAELVAAGARPRRDPTATRASLTAGELRVARLAAEGRTNREIAEALFLTENTVHTHLKSVFRKLAIGSRSQLTRAL